MLIAEGAMMAHVNFSQFTGLVAVFGVVGAWRAFLLIRQFLGRG